LISSFHQYHEKNEDDEDDDDEEEEEEVNVGRRFARTRSGRTVQSANYAEDDSDEEDDMPRRKNRHTSSRLNGVSEDRASAIRGHVC